MQSSWIRILVALRPDSVKTLTPRVAAELAKTKFGLSLDGLTTLTPEVAAELAKLEGALSLDGLTTLTPEVAAELAKHEGSLFLFGLTTLTPEVAAELAKHEALLLGGLTTLTSPSLAAKLAKKGRLSLDGLTTLTPEVAAELAKNEDALRLDGLTTLTPEVAAELAKNEDALFLDGLTTLTAEVAAELAKCKGRLRLDGLTTLTSLALVAKLANQADFPKSFPPLAKLTRAACEVIEQATNAKRKPLTLTACIFIFILNSIVFPLIILAPFVLYELLTNTFEWSSWVSFIGFLLIAIPLIWIYMLPSIIADNRWHPNTNAIFVLNLLAGWLFIPWVIALVWALLAIQDDVVAKGKLADFDLSDCDRGCFCS